MAGGRKSRAAGILALLAGAAHGARLAVRRGTRSEALPRSRSPWNFARPSEILVYEEGPGGELVGFLQSASIGAGFLFLADDLQLAQLEGDDDAARRELAARALALLPVGKRLWWIGKEADEPLLRAAGYAPSSAAEAARALWPALALFGAPVALLPGAILALPLLPQAPDLLAGVGAAERAALAAAPPALAAALAAAALLGKAVLRGDGTARRR